MIAIRVNEDRLAYSFSFFKFKRIWLGNRFFNLSKRQRDAVMAHELYHVDHHHTEIRFLIMILFFPILGYICRNQELAADRHAVDKGFGYEMLNVLTIEAYEHSWLYPDWEIRKERIKSFLNEPFP